MEPLSTTAIVLRKISYGDADIILSLLTETKGKISVIAKNAKKSVKRFGGALDLFSCIRIIANPSRSKDLLFLQEASLVHPYDHIRTDIHMTAYASYWTEIVLLWVEEQDKQSSIYHLLEFALENLDKGHIHYDLMSIIFQIRFLVLTGFKPNLQTCGICQKSLDHINGMTVFDISKGCIICKTCYQGNSTFYLSKGTLKQLNWIISDNIKLIQRLKVSDQSIKESLVFLETFLPKCIDAFPKSLKFIYSLR